MRLLGAVALATTGGFVALSHEILWYRVYAFLTWSRASTFGLLLGAYLTGLAAGAFGARAFCRERGGAEVRALAAFLLAGAVAGYLAVPAVAELCRRGLAVAALPLFGLGAALLGTALPLVAHWGIPPGERVGARLAWVYLGNILGSAAGSLLTGFVLLELLPLSSVVVAVTWIALAMAAAAFRVAGARAALAGVVGLAVLAPLLADPLFDGVYEKLTFKDEYAPARRFALLVENRSGVVSVDREGTVRGGAVYDGRLTVDPMDDENDIIRAYAVFALRPAPRDLLVVGLGSGAWTQVLAQHEGVARVTVVEINPGYLDVLRFSPVVRSLLANPKVELVIDDGRRWLQRTERTFDAIVQNTTYHWRAHATNLLSREYLELCRRRLRPGGLLVTNTTHSRDAQRTALEVFPHVWVLERAVYASDAPLARDFAAWRALLLRYRIDGRPVVDPARADHRAALERMLDPARWTGRAELEERVRGARVITDDNMASEWR